MTCEPDREKAVDLRNSEITGDVTFPLQAGGMAEDRGRSINSIPHVLLPDRFSPASADSTSDCTGPDSSTPSSASPTRGDAPCSPLTGPECPSTRTYETWALDLNPDGNTYVTEDLAPTLRPGTSPGHKAAIFSAAASPARTSPSPDNDEDSQANDPASSSSSPESSTLFDPDGFSSRTYPASSPRTAVGTSGSSLERWPTSGTAWHGGFSTHVSSECRSDEEGCSSSEPSLTEILEPPASVPGKYSLSARAATGILRRADKRGRELPPHLHAALQQVAASTNPDDGRKTT